AIRQFSPYTQRSLGPLQRIELRPASEVTGLGSETGWWETSGASPEDGPADPVLDAADNQFESAWKVFADVSAHLLTWDAASVQRELDDQSAELEVTAAHVPAGAYDPREAVTELLAAADRL